MSSNTLSYSRLNPNNNSVLQSYFICQTIVHTLYPQLPNPRYLLLPGLHVNQNLVSIWRGQSSGDSRAVLSRVWCQITVLDPRSEWRWGFETQARCHSSLPLQVHKLGGFQTLGAFALHLLMGLLKDLTSGVAKIWGPSWIFYRLVPVLWFHFKKSYFHIPDVEPFQEFEK